MAVGSVSSLFRAFCKADPDRSEAISALDVLAGVLKRSDVTTVQGLHEILNDAIAQMQETDRTNLSVKSACELFQRFITLTAFDSSDDFQQCKQLLERRAEIFLSKVGACKQQIAENFLNLLPNGARVLLHSYSRVVLSALTYASKHGTKTDGIHCYVTTCMPCETGRKMTKALARLKISCTLIPDLSIAYLMPQVDLVILGAQAVVESGGILNDLGSSTIAMIAAAFGKPVYVLAESFKFIRAYPLDQQHIPEEFKCFPGFSPLSPPFRNLKLTDTVERERPTDFPELHSAWDEVNKHRSPLIERCMPNIDYTNPSYITYLVTDLGVLTPSVVSDELIKLYL
ncbi:unnamed protein product [Calicophoron daubneyi]|uniref:Translation initiation factor eIF2B subunit alpha n=1 Tax=Calicophoron daubneyi TaxID=300641 RepID=A0AAV2TSW2_CALDB